MTFQLAFGFPRSKTFLRLRGISTLKCVNIILLINNVAEISEFVCSEQLMEA